MSCLERWLPFRFRRKSTVRFPKRATAERPDKHIAIKG